ncbi:MAG: putative toxin-antitoxin system toxin component, PIN family [Synergistaceae bacterium]|jgi:putative PIN family toxin of toxin-antitoxin system|nr:putative toxin-antitoxin system toxin component, PIN family [Synergistaceae bacterium]
MLVVIDTNVLVSALYSRDGNPARIIALVQNDVLTACYDYRILEEYREVLKRPRFGFSEWEVNGLLWQIEKDGLAVSPLPLHVEFADEQDLKFYEVAKHCQAKLVTGNLKHFPKDGLVLSVKDFLAQIEE